jgi:N utilization substance protein B
VTSRREARRLALDVLYQADVTHADGPGVLAEWLEAGREVPEYTRELVQGVHDHRVELDRLVGESAQGWRVDRMPSLDRTILRIAAYELSFAGVPVGAAIDEAVRAAKELSTEDSGRFVNGVLGAIAQEVGRSRDPAAERQGAGE